MVDGFIKIFGGVFFCEVVGCDNFVIHLISNALVVGDDIYGISIIFGRKNRK